MMVFYCLNGMAPPYLSDLLTVSCEGLRTDWDLNVPATRLSTVGDMAFGKAAPEICKKLPATLKSCHVLTEFRSVLKTHLFRTSFT